LRTQQAAHGGTTITQISQTLARRLPHHQTKTTSAEPKSNKIANTAQSARNMKFATLQVRKALLKVANTPLTTPYFPVFRGVNHMK